MNVQYQLCVSSSFGDEVGEPAVVCVMFNDLEQLARHSVPVPHRPGDTPNVLNFILDT